MLLHAMSRRVLAIVSLTVKGGATVIFVVVPPFVNIVEIDAGVHSEAPVAGFCLAMELAFLLMWCIDVHLALEQICVFVLTKRAISRYRLRSSTCVC